MAKRKKITLDAYKTRARWLRDVGMIDVDLRKNLTPGKKAAITRLYQKHYELIHNRSDFVPVKLTKTESKYLSDKTHYSKNKKVTYIPRSDYLTKTEVVRAKNTDFPFIQDILPFDFIVKTRSLLRRRLSKKNKRRLEMQPELTKLEAIILAPLNRIMEYIETVGEDIDAPMGYSFTWMFERQNSFNTSRGSLKDALGYMRQMANGAHWKPGTPRYVQDKLISGVRLVIRKTD